MPAQAKLQPVERPHPEDALPRLGPALSEAKAQEPFASPALALQTVLADAFEDYQGEPRWSARRTLAFAVVTCAAFWMGVGLVVFRLLGH